MQVKFEGHPPSTHALIVSVFVDYSPLVHSRAPSPPPLSASEAGAAAAGWQ